MLWEKPDVVDKDPVQEQDDKNLDGEFRRVEQEQKLKEKTKPAES